MASSYVYLASPYSHPDPKVRRYRYEATVKFAARSVEDGLSYLFSPILHWHDVVTTFDLVETADFWWRYNCCMQRNAAALWVLQLEGWRESIGVQREIEFAEALDQPVERIDYVDE